MRRDFVDQTLIEMKQNKDIVFLTGDLGFNALEPIRDNFPDRFINVGIAESHMVGMAAGIALTGKKVIVYSIAPFSTMRPYEQIRTSICYDNLDVKIIGTGGGFNYPTHGVTHHTIEDVAIMSVLPHMQVFVPGYSWEAREATKTLLTTTGPGYIRLGKSPQVAYEQPSFSFAVGKGYVLRPGEDIVLITTGNVVDIAMETAELISNKNQSVAVISMPTMKPLDTDLIKSVAKKAKLICTIEEHSLIGGLGQMTMSALYESSHRPKLHAFGIPDTFVKEVGDREHLLRIVGLQPDLMAEKIKSILETL